MQLVQSILIVTSQPVPFVQSSNPAPPFSTSLGYPLQRYPPPIVPGNCTCGFCLEYLSCQTHLEGARSLWGYNQQCCGSLCVELTLEIVLYSRRSHRFGQYYCSTLYCPANEDLGRRFAKFLCKCNNGWIVNSSAIRTLDYTFLYRDLFSTHRGRL